VRYSAPEGLHDDCVVALALAAERARTGAPPAVLVCNPGAALATAWEAAGRYFARRRADPEWGWEPARLN
jgi:hypothetical protein